MPDLIDAHVGSRVRMRRTLMGLSQKSLASELAVTFQQVQKYEEGSNRIAAGRLARIGHILDVSPAWFFDDLPDILMVEEDRQNENLTTQRHSADEQLMRRETLELVRYMSRIKRTSTRQMLEDLIYEVSQSKGQCED